MSPLGAPRRLFLLARAALALALWVFIPATPANAAARGAPESEYRGSESCRSCHAAEFDAWRGSHHGMAMQPAEPESVRGNFAGASLAARGVSNRFFRRDGGYWVTMPGADGTLRDHRIAYTFGVEPLQQYLVEFPDGRIQAIPFAWDSRPQAEGGQRWFDLYPQFTQPTDEFFWAGPGQNWNFMCADCHSTDVRKGYDKTANRYASTWSEVSVGCEACHGPGARHIDWAGGPRGNDTNRGFDRSLARRVTNWAPMPGKHTLQPAGMRDSDQTEACWQCHSRRQQLHDAPASPRAGFLDRHRPSLLTAELYHADGQIDEEVFEWGSFLQAKMHARGVVCSDCHDPHSAGLRQPLATLCTQCHEAATYAVAAHHFHPDDSTGAQCVGCHMPSTTYMQIDARRDHSFRLPDPALSAEIGAPDACTRCHAGKPAGWAAGVLRERGIKVPVRPVTAMARAFHGGTRRDPAAGNQLAWIAADTAQPSIARASALPRLQQASGPNALIALRRAVADADPLLRFGAVEGATGLDPAARWTLLSGLLSDPVRAVRLEAAAALVADWPQLDATQRERLRGPLDEYAAAQEFNSDRGFARANLGNMHRSMGDIAAAEAEYRGAMAIEPGFAPAWVNLADMLRAGGRDAEGTALLEKGARELPRSGEIGFALGLARVRAGDRAGAEQMLARAAELAPEVARFHYVLGVARSEHDARAGLAALRRAAELDADPQYLYAACELAVRSGDAWARQCVDALRPLVPADVTRALEAGLAAGSAQPGAR